MAAEADLSDLAVDNGHLSVAGRDLAELPAAVAARFGEQVTSLDLSFNALRTVATLDQFPKLTSLVADNNELDDGFALPQLPQLRTLSLNNNKLADLEKLIDNLKQAAPQLQYLSLLKNPACPNDLLGGDDEDYNRYRLQVVYKLGGLKFLDSRPVTAAEKKEAARVGPYLKVARPKEDSSSQSVKSPTEPEGEASQLPEYGALPPSLAQEGEHSGFIGVSKYVYYGRHSEGNRFIRNSDL